MTEIRGIDGNGYYPADPEPEPEVTKADLLNRIAWIQGYLAAITGERAA